jgi:hypothetical protein
VAIDRTCRDVHPDRRGYTYQFCHRKVISRAGRGYRKQMDKRLGVGNRGNMGAHAYILAMGKEALVPREWRDQDDEAISIFRKRYASGEITKDQFDQMMMDMQKNRQG